MNIIELLPEFHEGGVERHVLALSNGLASRGHRVTVVSAGGKLEGHLAGVGHLRLPVHRKNPATALYSAARLASFARRTGADILHAHSRVPAWIAWIASRMSGVPLLLTAHALYSLNAGLTPYGHAGMVLCVSEAVRHHLRNIVRGESRVVLNGLPPECTPWVPPREGEGRRLLFVGRLTEKKGLGVALEALAAVSGPWGLDVVGDGPMRERLESRVRSLALEDRVAFHGFRDDADGWMARCACLLFPSLEEGMGLTLMRAVQMGVPVLASDLPALRELTDSPGTLLPPGDGAAWSEAIGAFLRDGTASAFRRERIPTVGDMVSRVEEAYRDVAHSRASTPVKPAREQ